jgi:hypothetical protein
MKGWWFGLAVVTGIHLYGLTLLPLPGEITDKPYRDLEYLLEVTRQSPNVLQWFVGDWPLGNGLYRPLPTVSFILDDHLWGNRMLGYRLTNWVMVLGVELSLVWLVWELFQNRAFAVGCGALYALWASGLVHVLPISPILWGISALCLLAFFLTKGDKGRWLLCLGVVALLFRELPGSLPFGELESQTLSYRLITWPPGRTAVMMTLFVLLSLSAYGRMERTGKKMWGYFSVVGYLGALMSYEQAVALPGVLLACGLVLQFQGVKVHWHWHIVFWVMAILFAFLHSLFLRPDTRYRLQQARSILSGVREMGAWLFPGAKDLETAYWLFARTSLSWLALWLIDFWKYLLSFLFSLVGFMEARRRWLPCAFGLFTSVGAYGVIAFQKTHAHYYAFPLTLRTVFVASLLIIGWELAFSERGRPAERGETAPCP